jgi:hypothetical protein
MSTSITYVFDRKTVSRTSEPAMKYLRETMIYVCSSAAPIQTIIPSLTLSMGKHVNLSFSLETQI